VTGESARTQKLGEIATAVRSKDAKPFSFFMSPIQRGLSATYSMSTLTGFHAFIVERNKAIVDSRLRFVHDLKSHKVQFMLN